MKKHLLASLILLTAGVLLHAEESSETSKNESSPVIFPAGIMGTQETAQVEITKVYSFEYQGASFKAYAVKYKDGEVVVTDTLGTSDKKPGDKITIMVHRMDIPYGEKQMKFLQFILMDFDSFKMR